MTAARLVGLAACIAFVATAASGMQDRPPHQLDVTARFVDPPSAARVGDALVFEIEIGGEGARDARLVAEPDFGGLEPRGEPERSTDRKRVRIRYTLQPFDTGRFVVPPIEIANADERASTDECTIVVASLAAANDAAADAKLVLPTASGRSLLPVALASIVVAALGYRASRRLAGRPAPGELALARALLGGLASCTRGVAAPRRSPRPSVPIERSTLAEIDAFTRAAADDYDATVAHAALARIATSYVEGSLRLRPRERTTREVVRVASARFSESAATELARVLEACDRVKFARSQPDLAVFRETAAALRRAVRTARGE